MHHQYRCSYALGRSLTMCMIKHYNTHPDRATTWLPEQAPRDRISRYSAASGADLVCDLLQRAGKGVERETHHVFAWRHDDGAEDDIGLEDIRGGAVDAGAPPRMPDV